MAEVAPDIPVPDTPVPGTPIPDAPETDAATWPAVVENAAGRGAVVIVCEHASNHLPAPWGGLGLGADQRAAHIAWDPGALGLARGLAGRLDAVLAHAPVSRLVHDLNRAPDQPGAMPERSETHDIPGNRALSPEARAARVEAVYLPFHATLHGLVAGRLARGKRPVIVTVHSFTPVYMGTARAVEFGVIHDADDRLAHAVAQAARAMTGLATELNAPYSAADGVTHTLRLHALPYGLANVMLEIRNDLITTPGAETAMADMLAPVLTRAIEAVEG